MDWCHGKALIALGVVAYAMVLLIAPVLTLVVTLLVGIIWVVRLLFRLFDRLCNYPAKWNVKLWS